MIRGGIVSALLAIAIFVMATVLVQVYAQEEVFFELDMSTNGIISINILPESLQGTDLSNKYEIHIYKNNNLFKYFGEVIFPISIPSDKVTEVVILDRISKKPVFSESFEDQKLPEENLDNKSINDSYFGEADGCLETSISLSRESVDIGEEVTVTINNYLKIYETEKVELSISDSINKYVYVGIAEQIPFIPNNADSYEVVLKCKDIIYSKNFTAGGEDQTVLMTISPPGNEKSVGEAITININGFLENYSLEIINPESSLRYTGSLNEPIGLVLEYEGQYSFILKNEVGETIESQSFIVSGQKYKIPGDSDNMLLNSKKEFLEVEEVDMGNFKKIIPKKGTIKKIIISKEQKGDIGIDEVNTKKVKISNKPITNAFAIDPLNKSFNVSFVAQGTELYKCKEWNFSTQTCEGTWEKLMDTIPGKEYTIELNGADPGFAETGLTTINTRHALYKPNETVTLLMVVLDSEGFVVEGSDVNVTITTPNNTTYFYDSSQVTELGKGVYELNYSITDQTGNYHTYVQANDSVNLVEVNSYFTISDFFEFDISRESLLVMDPFTQIFNGSIIIEPQINVSTYNLTEILPINFTNISITNTPDGSLSYITSDSENYYIRWENLSGISELNYSANPPQISPYVITQGPAEIEYNTGLFIENRVWYLALDPLYLNDQDLSTNDSSVEKGNTVLITGNLICSKQGGGETPLDFDIWVEDDNVAIDTTTSSVDFSCGGVSSVSVDLCEATSCNVNSDCTVTVVGCAKNDDIDISWTFTAEGDNEPTDSSNTLTMDTDIADSLDNSVSVTITGDAVAPTSTLNYPPISYVNDSADPLSIDFNCSATDNSGLSNLSLYLTNPDNTTFQYNDSCSVSGGSDECIFSKSLSAGNYTWNCLATDTSSNTAFATTNRTLFLNYSFTLPPLEIDLISPPQNSVDGDGTVFFICNATDGSDIENVTLYTNHTGTWAPRNTSTFSGASDENVSYNYSIIGINNGTIFDWNCLAFDDEGNSEFAVSNYTVNVTYLPENPSVYLNSPENITTVNNEPITFNCSATDNFDISSVNLYLKNKTGSFVFKETKQFTGSSDSDVEAIFNVGGFVDIDTITWNCKAIDNNSNEVFATDNYTVYVDFLKPNVTLLSPSDYSYDLDGSISLTCNTKDESDIVNVSLFHNIEGAWVINQTTTYGGGSDTDENDTFSVTVGTNDTEFQWNCLAYDNDGFKSFAESNYTITIPPNGIDYYAEDGSSGGTWLNPNRADENPDGLTANADLDSQFNLFTFNYAGIPQQGTLLQTYLSMRWAVSTQPDPGDADYLGMQYSPNTGTDYYSLAGGLNGYTQPGSYPSSQTNYSYLISGSLSLANLNDLYYRVTGFKVSGPDNVNTLVDSIWLTARISPPPYYTHYGRNQSVVYQNDSMLFSTYWIDDINLDCFIFSINQTGVWENSTCTNLQGKSDNGTIAWEINATPGTTVEWRVYARDNFNDYNVTTTQSFVVSDANDAIPPRVENLTADPVESKSLSTFNLSANITDNIGVVSATIQITNPTGSLSNYSMTKGFGNNWYYLYDGLIGGQHSFKIFAYDGGSNLNESYSEYFNVTALIQTDKYYYDRGETANIFGYGFSSSGIVEFDVQNSTSISQVGFPSNSSANSDGNSSKTWSIPSNLNFELGNYTFYGTDTNSSLNLADNTTAMVVIKPDYALKTDDLGTGDVVTSIVNNSDNSRTTLVGDATEVYTELRFQNNIQAGYALDELYLYVEHTDLDPESDTIDIQYSDGSTWFSASCGSLTYRATETIDVCNLTSHISNISNVNDIRLRLSDGNDGNSGVDFADIDFAYLDVEFSITNTLSVTIDYPANIMSTYDFQETGSNSAYDDEAATVPPAATPQLSGTEASSTEYGYLDISDNGRWQSIATTSGNNIYQSFYFTISEAEEDVIKLSVTHEGYATQKTSLDADPYRMYFWDYDADDYVLISVDPITGSTSDQTTEIEVDTAVGSYIDSNGEINLLIVGDYTLGGCGNPANCRADIYTDYVKVDVERISTISGLEDINVTAIDGDGVQSCSYFYSNSTQTFSTIGLYNISSVLWTNVSNTADYGDGLFNITANCTDGTEIVDDEYVTVRILNNPPHLTLVAPENLTNFTWNAVNFTWNASSDAGNPSCDLFLDGTENISNVISSSGQNTIREISGIPDGVHTWYVQCNIDGGQYNVSETRTFQMDVAGPTIYVNNPDNNTFSNENLVTFNYTPVDVGGIVNCSLLIDGSSVDTNYSIASGQPNLFNYTFASGSYEWEILCYDNFAYNGTSGKYNIIIDTIKPWINLSYPTIGQTFLGGLVQFNYTAYDNQDTSLLCNITVDDAVLAQNIVSPNGSSVIRNLVVGAGFKHWNVTCIDNALNTNTSQTWNFTVQGPPTVTLIDPDDDAFNYTNIFFDYYVGDQDGINNCSLYIDGNYNDTNFTVQNASNNNFTKYIPEGYHNWTVQCFDTQDKVTTPEPNDFTVDITAPYFNLYAPGNNTNETIVNVTFNFSVFDNLDTDLLCNITIDGTVYTDTRDFIASNGSNTSKFQPDLDAGETYWNVTCIDDAGNYNTSPTWFFNIGAIPTVNLNEPQNNTQVKENVTFYYTPSDFYGFQNCTLYINGQPNSTDDSISNGFQNEFTANFTGEQYVEWYVMCVNDDGIEGISHTRNFEIDTTPPTVTLNYPDEDIINNATIDFNFTVTDNNASIFWCDVYTDGVLNETGISADAGIPEIVQVSGFTAGSHNWSVICQDNATNTNTPSLNNFTVSFGPSVSLTNPYDGFVTNATTAMFNYTVSSVQNIDNCSLIINGNINQSNQTNVLFGGSENNFTISDIEQGIFNWTVQCTDTDGVSSTIDEIRTLHVDRENPYIVLDYPSPEENISLSFVKFNFTAYDSVDDVLICNLSVYNGGVLNKSQYNFNATEGEVTEVTLYNFTTGDYDWNVSCWDGFNYNDSETRNFSISNIPTIDLLNPYNGYSDPDGYINFTYIPQTISAGWQYCTFILDGEQNDSEVVIQNGEVNSFDLNFTTSGTHTWQINCTDLAPLNATSEIRNFTVDLVDPNITLNYPLGQTLNSNSIQFNFTAYDNIDTNLSCDIYINNTYNTSTYAESGVPELVTINGFVDGFQEWNVTCMDDANRTANSTIGNFTVQEPPSISLGEPANGTRDNGTTQIFYYTPYDNSLSLASCTLVINGVANVSNSTSLVNAQEHNFTVLGLINGNYSWDVNCTDPSGNVGNNGTPSQLYIDLQGPNIQLHNPGIAQTFNQEDIFFNWTPTDFNSSVNITCDLFVTDGAGDRLVENISGFSGTVFNTTVLNLTEGSHSWNVTCADDLGNTNYSETRSFTINQPDLYINTSSLSFSNNNPSLYEEINITANVSNIGGLTVNNAYVEFWDGDPAGAGVQIGNATNTVIYNSSALFTIQWNITPGYHTIYVLADPLEAVGELNETNNNATINISAFHVNITYPKNDTLTSDSTPRIDFNTSDFTGNNIDYTIFVDGSANGQTDTVSDGANTSISINALGDGTHLIIVQGEDVLGRLKNSTPLTIKIDTTEPTTIFITTNATWHSITTVNVSYNITDEFSNTSNYKVFLDDVFNRTNTTPYGEQINDTFYNLAEGIHTVIIEATDELGNVGNSTPLYFYVDLTAPTSNITTSNESWFNTNNPLINFNITDNLDTVLNYTLYVNGTANVSGSANNASAASDNLIGLVNGSYEIILEAYDEAGWYTNSTSIIIYVDTIKPSITLDYPGNNTNNSNTTMDLNFTVTDNMADYLICNLTLDGSVVGQNLNVNNGAQQNVTVSSLNGGYHYWNVTCIDRAVNDNTSLTYRFYVERPDLFANYSAIYFSNNQPIENETINVTATIQNIGNNDAFDFTVQFWQEAPVTGVQIGSDILLNLTAGSSQNVTVNYTAPIGPSEIFIVVDTPTATNGSIQEENESNNIASKNLTVGLWHYVFGNTGDKIVVEDAVYRLLYDWNVNSSNGSNLFVADYDANIDWTQLLALGINTSNLTASDDFEDLDVKLNSTTFPDSVNSTYTNAGSPIELADYNVYSNLLENVSIVNSTNNTNFKTGILWDYSDGGNEYNGTQDVLFISQVKEDLLGYNETVDFEVRIPATLRDYSGPDYYNVVFYIELT